MKNSRILNFYLLLLFSLAFFSISAFAFGRISYFARTAVPVGVTVSYSAWVETISICNNGNTTLPLTDMELDFRYAVTMPTNIWGQPLAGWRVDSQQGNAVVLLGGAPLMLPPDPNCNYPITIQFNASPTSPAPTGPFIFKVALTTPPPIAGKLNVRMQAAPASGLPNPQVTVRGVGNTFRQSVPWASAWLLNNLDPGSYTVTSSDVNNGRDYFVAAPITVTVNGGATAQVSVQYRRQSQPSADTSNGTWAYDKKYTSNGGDAGVQPGLFASNINRYNAQASPGHKLTQVFSYGGSLEMVCHGSGGSTPNTPCTASTMLVYYSKNSTSAYYNAAQTTANPVEMLPIVDGEIGADYLKTFNTLTQSEASIFADNVARLYCADDTIVGVQFDLEPFDISQRGQAYFYAQIAKDFAGQHNGPGQADPYRCVNANHPNGRIFSVFTFAEFVTPALANIFNRYGNGIVIDSLYDLADTAGGVVTSVSAYTTYVNDEVTNMKSRADDNNVKYQFGIPAAASVHEFESVDGRSTGFRQIDYVKAAINAINGNNVRSDPLFKGIHLWGWNQRMFWGGKEFKPSIPDATVQAYLGTEL